ncbi:cold-shock protein [Enterococcus alishanensis]
MQKGTVKWFNGEKVYGFIVNEGSGTDIFVQYSEIVGDGYRNLEAGQLVAYTIGENSKGTVATNVVPE